MYLYIYIVFFLIFIIIYYRIYYISVVFDVHNRSAALHFAVLSYFAFLYTLTLVVALIITQTAKCSYLYCLS